MPSLAKLLALLAFSTVSGFCHGHNSARAAPELFVPRSLSNAERLARGLPLKPPTRPSSARRASTSPIAASRGYIQVLAIDREGNSHGVLGFVSRNLFQNAHYIVQPSIDDALEVSPNGRDLVTLNTEGSSHRFLGLVQGREDTSPTLAKGSANYLYLASTDQTPSDAPPQSVGNTINDAYGGSFLAESAVWILDPVSHKLVADWINPDYSPASPIALAQGSVIYFTDDPVAFHRANPAPLQRIVCFLCLSRIF
ncbi:hypothetical protein C8F01DRAFT_1099968 [Mycena amicta]|nr:hypothetical protein C8F01DRAFT_1099968 [Mycena amicta]